jgi:hypothetical protein
MSADEADRVGAAFRDTDAITRAMEQAAEAAFQRHSWTRVPMAIWKDGKVVLIDPNEPSEDIPKWFRPPRSWMPDWNRL